MEELALDAVEGRATLSVFASDRFSPLHSASAAATQQFREKVRLERGVEVRTATVRMSSSNTKRGSGSKGHLKMDTRGHDVSVAVGAGDRCAISQVYRVSWRFSDSTTTRRATRRRWSFIAAVDSSRAPSDRTTSVISRVCPKLTASCFAPDFGSVIGGHRISFRRLRLRRADQAVDRRSVSEFAASRCIRPVSSLDLSRRLRGS